MFTLTPLVEYLLAYQKPEGTRVCRLGVVQTVIPYFPGNTAITLDVYPEYGAEANIEFFVRLSPQIVPGAFQISSIHYGVEQGAGGTLYSLGQGQNIWVEITQAHPVHTTIANVTNVGQFYEVLDWFLIVQSLDDLRLVHEIVREFGSGERPGKLLAEIRDILAAIAGQRIGGR